MKLEIAKIRLDGGTQPRAALNKEVIGDYCERMKEGVSFDPVTVYFDGENYWMADGFHRVTAAKRAGLLDINAEIVQGTQSEAQWHSYGVNKNHGLRRTNEDKARAVRSALVHPHGKNSSDRQIAEHVGVSYEMVRKHRAKIAPDCQPLIVTECSDSAVPVGQAQNHTEPPDYQPLTVRKRTGRDGRTINTAKIGKSRKKKPFRPRSPLEIYEARQAGQKVARPACLVKLKLPNNNVENCAYDLLRHFTFKYLRKVFAHIVKLHQNSQEKES